MADRVEAIVEPELLIWARSKAGLDVETAAKKASVSHDSLGAWEKGEARPSIAQLRRLGRAYKRPIAVFYLPEPPRDFPPIRDFRVVWERDQVPPSPELGAEIRAAYDRREIALELLEGDAATFGLTATLDDDPEIVAGRLRHVLGIDLPEQLNWNDHRQGFNAWRRAVE
jgi:transcriptional regulator with XRE-family HTH domain